jgi:phthalate 4,5-dioxygenase oxygenase subunit
MGSLAKQPPFPNFEWTLVPSENRSLVKVREECNFLQAIEGAVDTSHGDILQQGAILNGPEDTGFNRPTKDIQPRIHMQPTAYGFRYGSIRTHISEPERLQYLRIMTFVMPVHCLMTSGELAQIFVPIDDDHTWNFNFSYSKEKPIDRERHRRQRRHVVGEDMNADGTRIPTMANRFMQDRDSMRARKSWAGMEGGPNRDMAMQESMGRIKDRAEEHLGESDYGVVYLRQYLLDALRANLAGGDPPGTASSVDYSTLRGIETVAPVDVPWEQAQPRARSSDGSR